MARERGQPTAATLARDEGFEHNGRGAGSQQNTGQAIITVTAGGVLTLRNHTSAAAVGIASVVGGTQANTNASVAIEQAAIPGAHLSCRIRADRSA